MKIKYFIIDLCLISCISISYVNSQQIEKSELFTLAQGEKLLNVESCIPLTKNGKELKIVTLNNGKVYFYDKGVKKGPFNKVKEVDLGGCEANYGSVSSIYDPQDSDDYSNYVKNTDDGQFLVTFNEQKYGPFQTVMDFKVSEDKKKMAFVGMNISANNAVEAYLVSSAGGKVKIEGEPGRLILSASGNVALVTTKVSPSNMMNDMQQFQNVDFTKMTQDEMMKMAAEMEKKAKSNENATKSFIVTQNGTKFGPYSPDELSYNNPAFCITGGDNWMLEIEHKLYINGKVVKDFGEQPINISQTWIAKDGKSFGTLADYDKIIFSDGTSFPFPLKIEAKEIGGKMVFDWVTLENNQKLIYYRKTF